MLGFCSFLDSLRFINPIRPACLLVPSFIKICADCNKKIGKGKGAIYLTIWQGSLLHFVFISHKRSVAMGTKMKGIYRGFKYTLSQIFVVKEREMEIGHPTDVKHLAHIGWDGPSGAAPTWMNEFRTGPDFASTSVGHSGSALSPWSSQDFGESMHHQSGSEMFKDTPSTDLPSIKKKQKRKKTKSTSSPKSTSSCSSRSSRVAKSKTKFVEGNSKPANIEVA